MANVQLEKGHTRIANEILNNVMQLDLNATQYRIIIAVWRFTYGFHRKEYEMSSSFISEKTGIHAVQVRRELKILQERNIILQHQGKRGAWILRFNKNHDEWIGKEGKTVKKKTPKTSKKKKVVKYENDNTYYKMAVYFHKLVAQVAKDAGVEHLVAKANLQSWANDMRLLVEKDEVDKRLAKDVMDWVTQHDFWRTNVLSASKLRNKFPELAIKMNQEKKPQQQPRHADPRDREIALQQWIAEGNDPDEFTWN